MTIRSKAVSNNDEKYDSLLIIESDKMQSKGIAMAMFDHFSDIDITAEPVEAIKLASNKKYQVIIAELKHKAKEDLEALKILRELNPFTILITLNNEVNPNGKSISSELNVYKSFDKPITLKTLLNAVEAIKLNKSTSAKNNNK